MQTSNIHVTVKIVDNIVTVAGRHLLRAQGERVEDGPYPLQSFSVCHTNPRQEIIGVRGAAGARVRRSVKFANARKGVGEEHDLKHGQGRKLLLKLPDTTLEMDAVLTINVVAAAMSTEGEVRGKT